MSADAETIHPLTPEERALVRGRAWVAAEGWRDSPEYAEMNDLLCDCELTIGTLADRLSYVYGPEHFGIVLGVEEELRSLFSRFSSTPSDETSRQASAPRVATAEQKARDLLERIGVAEAQSFSSGELVELANLIASEERYRAAAFVALNAAK